MRPRRHHRRVGLHRRRTAAPVRPAPRPRRRRTPPATPRPAPAPPTCIPSLAAAYPDLVFEAFDLDRVRRARPRVPRAAARGIDGAGARSSSASVGVRRRPVGRLPAEGRRRSTRSGTASSTTSPSCSPRPCTACPSCTGPTLKGAELVATPGCYVTAAIAGAGAARRGRARSSPPASSSTPRRACRAPAAA